MSQQTRDVGSVPTFELHHRMALAMEKAEVSVSEMASVAARGGTAMRRILALVLVAMALLVASGCQPTEPAMTITAKQIKCNHLIEGHVTPFDATSQVTLQRTVNGKWVDWKWYHESDSTQTYATSGVSDSSVDLGYYVVNFSAEYPYTYKPLPGPLHMRVRSKGGTTFSNGVYVTTPVTAPCA